MVSGRDGVALSSLIEVFFWYNIDRRRIGMREKLERLARFLAAEAARGGSIMSATYVTARGVIQENVPASIAISAGILYLGYRVGKTLNDRKKV